MAEAEHDLVVIGAGPGGYVAAIRAAQAGLKVGCIDREPLLGGTCLRIGCIPSKALLESSELFEEAQRKFKEHGIRLGDVGLDLQAMMRRKDRIVTTLTKGIEGLFKKHGIRHYQGLGRLTGPGRVTVEASNGSGQKLRAKHIIIATGSKPARLKGVELDGDRIGTSTEALAYKEVPKRLAVIGAGYIGLEMGSVWRRLGSKVTVLEYLDRILPGMDEEMAAEARKVFEKQGMEFRLGMKVSRVRVDGEECVVEAEGAEAFRVDRVLLAAGRAPNTDGVGLEKVGVKVDKKGRVEVDERFRTNVEGIYAIGDVIQGPMLAHKAEEDGVACVDFITKGHGHVDYGTVPAVAYTEPEIASVGQTEEQLKESGVEFKKGVFPYMANGRARALGKTDGKVKILADAKTDRVLGIHIIGARAGDLIAEAAVAMAFGASAEDISLCSHAHPTLAEVVKEAALSVSGQALHL